MDRFRHAFTGVIILSALLLMTGCAERMVCAEPNVLVGDVCCLDADSNDVCDTWEEEELEQVAEVPEAPSVDPAIQQFAETFASTWDRKSYTALHNLFVRDYRLKYASKEFNFLARKADAALGIADVALLKVDGDTATYSVRLGDKSVTVSADIDKEDGIYLHDQFYFFDGLSAESACQDDKCFMDFAVLTGDRNYCEDAGDLRNDCVAEFGVSKTITQKIDDCLDVKEYYSMTECLTQVAVKENDIEPCWHATYDKQIFECMGEVAAARKDVDECGPFVSSKGYPGTRLQHAYCIAAYVRITADTDACSLIDRRDDVVLGAMQENCYKLNFP
jgi:hypothetical protein